MKEEGKGRREGRRKGGREGGTRINSSQIEKRPM